MTREEAIEYLNTLYMALAVFPNQQISLGNVDEMKESVNMAIKALEQEPKTGHWKIIPFGNNHGEYRPKEYVCSECGWKIDLCRGLQQDTGHRLFCEHCGADMRKE